MNEENEVVVWTIDSPTGKQCFISPQYCFALRNGVNLSV